MKEAIYLSDILGREEAKSMRDEGTRDGIDAGFHSENLYDEQQTTSGEYYNLVDGVPINNVDADDKKYYERNGYGYVIDIPAPDTNPNAGSVDYEVVGDEVDKWIAQRERELAEQRALSEAQAPSDPSVLAS